MLRNQWYVVLESREVKHKPIGVTRMGEKLVFWRDAQGQVRCLRDRCAHRGAALSKGRVTHGHIACPFHGFEYDATGQCQVIPANGHNSPVPERFKVGAYPTHEAHDWIWIWWGEPRDTLPPTRFFDDIDDTFVYATIQDPWDTHYSRVLENQLDVVHLPFVHHNTIGRGERTVVDGPGVEWVDDDLMYVYVYNRADDGTPPRKPDAVPVPDPTRDYKLELLMPNLWQNRIGEKVRVVGAFVPVDATHTLLYLRFYQKFLRVPLLGQAITRLAMPFNRLVAHQDRRVVNTQEPKASGLKIGERLVPGDRPIVAYRTRRHALRQEAEKDASEL